MIADATLLAVFVTGLLGGVHCAGMCGGIVSALSMMGRRSQSATRFKPAPLSVSGTITSDLLVSTTSGNASSNNRQTVPVLFTSVPATLINSIGPQLSTSLYYNLGRIGMYTGLGFLVGSLGSLSFLLEHALPVQQFTYFASSVLLIVMGVYLAGVKRVAAIIESIGQPLWNLIKPHAVSRMQRGGSANLVVTGALWGLVPCGMVYGVLTMALLAGSGIRGAMLMLVFGLGTLPNLLLLGVAGGAVKRAINRVWVRRSVAAVIVSFGVLGLLRVNSIAAQVNDLPLLRDMCRVIN